MKLQPPADINTCLFILSISLKLISDANAVFLLLWHVLHCSVYFSELIVVCPVWATKSKETVITQPLFIIISYSDLFFPFTARLIFHIYLTTSSDRRQGERRRRRKGGGRERGEEVRWGKVDEEEEEWEESALLCEHLEVKPIRQDAQPEIHRGRSLYNIYTIYSTSTTCFQTTNYPHGIIKNDSETQTAWASGYEIYIKDDSCDSCVFLLMGTPRRPGSAQVW